MTSRAGKHVHVTLIINIKATFTHSKNAGLFQPKFGSNIEICQMVKYVTEDTEGVMMLKIQE